MKIIDSNRTIFFLVVPSVIAVSALWFVSSFSTANSTEFYTNHIQNVKHNSSHDSSLNSQSQSFGTATVIMKIDIIYDSSSGTGGVNNKQLKFLVQVSYKIGDPVYMKTVYGSPDIINLPVTTSPGSTSEDPDKLTVKFDGPFCTVGCHITDWEFNESVSTATCEDEIWDGATIQCHLVIHYAWV